MKYISILIAVMTLFSCSTAKKTDTPEIPEPKPQAVRYDSLLLNEDIRTLKLTTSLEVDARGSETSAKAKIIIAGRDSLNITLIGPFGVTLAKLYSNKDYFVFYNVFQNEAMEGSPTRENFKKIMNLDFSFEDAVRLLRGDAPGEPGNYIRTEEPAEQGNILLRNLEEEQLTYALYSNYEKALTKIERKTLEGQLIASINYSQFSAVKGVRYPFKIMIEYPGEDTDLELNSTEVSINERITETFRFNIPSSVKRKKL